ncbi:hypothetical protein D3C87_1406570 [compost metagenome]
MHHHSRIAQGDQAVGLITVSEERPGHRLAHQQTDNGMPGQTCAGITVRRTGQRLMNAERLFTTTVSLAWYVNDGDQRTLLRFVLIRRDHFIHSLGQTPTFKQTDFAIAGSDETVVRVSHHGDKPHGLPGQESIGDFQRGRQTVDRIGIGTQGVEPVQASEGIRTHERSP